MKYIYMVLKDVSIGINELNNICAIYGHGEGATGARSVNIDDINKACGVTIPEKPQILMPSESILPLGVDENTNEETLYGNWFTYNDLYATPQDFINKVLSGEFYCMSEYYIYSGSSELVNTSKNQRLYDLIFANTSDSEQYYLASISTIANWNFAAYGFSGVLYDRVQSMSDDLELYRTENSGQETAISRGIRPVIQLDANVSKEIINKTGN